MSNAALVGQCGARWKNNFDQGPKRGEARPGSPLEAPDPPDPPNRRVEDWLKFLASFDQRHEGELDPMGRREEDNDILVKISREVGLSTNAFDHPGRMSPDVESPVGHDLVV